MTEFLIGIAVIVCVWALLWAVSRIIYKVNADNNGRKVWGHEVVKEFRQRHPRSDK